MKLPLDSKSFLLLLDRAHYKMRQTIGLLGMPFETLVDMLIYVSNCRLSLKTQKSKKDSYDLIFFAHTIEKGLSLPSPRPLFGQNNISRILYLLEKCNPRDITPVAIEMSLGTLDSYLDFHKQKFITDATLEKLSNSLDKIKNRFTGPTPGGTKKISHVFPKIQSSRYSYGEFISSRYSCRNFSSQKIHDETIIKIIEIAKYAPSQCNRQSVKIHFYNSANQINSLLSLQGGARGFMDTVPLLAVVTSDINAWVGKEERNQCYVDGGLFAMNFLLAAHSIGIAACPLNFSKTNLQERKFRRAAFIPSNQRIVMLIALGYQDKNSELAAYSSRRTFEDVVEIHTATSNNYTN